MTLPFVAAFHDIAVRGKCALFFFGCVLPKGGKVNPCFPFFGHFYHAGLVQIVVAQFTGILYLRDMHEIIHIIGKVNDLPDILKALFLLQGSVELR